MSAKIDQIVREARTPAACPYVNVGQEERLLSAIGGAAAILAAISPWGQRRRPLLALGGIALLYRGVTGNCPMYQSLGLSYSRATSGEGAGVVHKGVRVEECIRVKSPAEDLFVFWRDVTTFPQFMHHVKSVEKLDDRRSRWTVQGPLRRSYSWEAEIYQERPHELIAWRSLPGSQVQMAGSVRFQEQGPETEVHVTISYEPPGGALGAGIAALLGSDPSRLLREDIQRFKEVVEIPASS